MRIEERIAIRLSFTDILSVATVDLSSVGTQNAALSWRLSRIKDAIFD